MRSWSACSRGVLLLSAVLIVWRRSIAAEIRLLAVQGAALAGLVTVLGVHETEHWSFWWSPASC